MLRQLPNILTALRILSVAPLGWLVLREQFQWALLVGVIAGITDGLDGFLAKAKDDELSPSALKVKNEILKAQASA